MKLWLSVALVSMLGLSCAASDTFSDVPKDHWAAESVQAVSEDGVMHGYPDNTFGGDKHVTRYELAAALANFVEYVKNTQKPLVEESVDSTLSPQQHWGQSSMDYLRINALIPEDSTILKDGQELVTQDELARALASIGAQLVALRVPLQDEEE